jgi:hypothetical protein
MLTRIGVVPGRPIAAVEVSTRPDRFDRAFDRLAAAGFQIVRVGASVCGPLPRSDVIDLTAAPGWTAEMERQLLFKSTFIVGETWELQHAAYLAAKPSLRLDARDPMTAYPVRADSLFALSTTVDLDTGRVLGVAEMLREEYVRRARHCGYRPTSALEVDAGVHAMIDGIRQGWRETEAQARFRHMVAEAAARFGARVRHLVEWDTAAGYVGDGRVIQEQAARMA